MFKTEAIILSIYRIHDGNTRIVLLSKEYGKISCWYKKRQFLHDIWDIIFLTIERTGSINILKYSESIASPREESWNYNKITLFLESLALMYTLIPDMSPYGTIFQDYRWLLLHMSTRTSLEEHHYILFQFRILRTLWYIGDDTFQSSAVWRYIYENILHTPLENLLSSKKLKEGDENTIKWANREAIYRSTL